MRIFYGVSVKPFATCAGDTKHAPANRMIFRYAMKGKKLRSVIASCGESDADAVAACVEEAVLEMGDADPRDDIAILALQVRGTRGRRDVAQDAAAVRG